MASTARSGATASVDQFRPEDIGVDLLLFFTAVAEDLSFTKAAGRLNIDQSWLSHKIRQLEAQLGCSLFNRSTRHVELTGAGLKLLAPARTLSRAAQEARLVAQGLSKGLKGTLRIGALPYSFANPDRVSLIDRFIAEHADTEVDVVNGSSPQLITRVRQGDLDLAFVSSPFDTEGLELTWVRLDRFAMMVPLDHPLAAKAELSLADMKGQRMVMPNPEHNKQTFASLFQPFIAAGVIATTIPEFQSNALYRYARQHGSMVLCKEVETASHAHQFAIRWLSDHEAANDKYLVRLKGSATPQSDAFWSIAGEANAAGRQSRAGRR